MLKKITIIIVLVTLVNCSGTIDTTNLTPEKHLEYAMSLYNDGDYEEAIREFQSIILQFAGNSVNDDAQYYLGMTYYNQGQYLLAAYEFSKLIRDIPASKFVPDAQFMLADSYYELSPPFQLDQKYTKKAIDEFQAYIDFFPTNPKVQEAEKKIKELNNKLAEKEFNAARIYKKMEYYNAAIKFYGRVADTYHDTKYAPLALYNKIDLLLYKKRTKEALRDIAEFLGRYPDNEKAEELKNKLKQLAEAK